MRRGIIYIDDNYVEFGTINESPENIKIEFEGSVVWGESYELCRNYVKFNYATGCYVFGKEDLNTTEFPFGRDAFPYNLDRHIYNAKFEEHLFKNKQVLDRVIAFKHIDELPYTFGLEFETAGGYLPQHELYELGLIPLRDGSITGIEYTTVVLQGNRGLNMLKKQMEALNKHTIFDKDCSLHIHLGGFRLDGNVLLRVNNLFANSDLRYYLPSYTFDTTAYKSNRDKNYCAYNNRHTTFESMYETLVGRHFYGDFTQPHPNDLTGTRKWNIKGRYRAVNFINALCYDGPKTIEFRMLRPTYNFEKVLGWLFIYAAFVKYAEAGEGTCVRCNTRIESILRAVYSEELANALCDFLEKSKQIVYVQGAVGDYYGMRVDIEDKVINYETFGHFFYSFCGSKV